jgi:HK97 gp10 family phage protein
MASEGISITIDSVQVERALLKFTDEAKKELRLKMKNAMRDVEIESKTVHPTYRTHSGQADRSIKSSANNDGTMGTVFIDDSVARYARFLHDGTKYIKAGKYMRNAFFRQEPKIRTSLQQAFKDAMKKSGLKI